MAARGVYLEERVDWEAKEAGEEVGRGGVMGTAVTAGAAVVEEVVRAVVRAAAEEAVQAVVRAAAKAVAAGEQGGEGRARVAAVWGKVARMARA